MVYSKRVKNDQSNEYLHQSASPDSNSTAAEEIQVLSLLTLSHCLLTSSHFPLSLLTL